MTRNAEKYFNYLVEEVELDGKSEHYSMLLEKLFKSPFEASERFELDIDRVKNALDMREFWASKHVSRAFRHEFLDSFGEGISVLEFMVSLSKSMSDTLYFDEKLEDFFWPMIENLGLDCMNDDEFDEAIVDDILTNLWLRKYKRDGSGGGLFYVPNAKFDMRKIDFMLQANLWISYNFVR